MRETAQIFDARPAEFAGLVSLAESMIPSTDRTLSSVDRLKNLLVSNEELPPIGPGVDLHTASSFGNRWYRAKKRFDAVMSVLRDPSIIRDLNAHARKAGVHVSTLYRWLHEYANGRESLADFLDRPRRCGNRLPAEVENIVEKALQSYQRDNRPSQVSVWRKVRRTCRAKGLPVPHVNTVRLRIHRLPEEQVVKTRLGRRAARVMFRPHRKGFAPPEGPLALVQIDHTPIDLILLDEESREPIGRAYLTLVEDTYSRAILGFEVTLDEPGALSVGLALFHAISPKKSWLDEIGVNAEWPFHGLPRCVFVDNAMEFHGRMLRLWAENYACDLQFRPLRRPESGPHVERCLRTIATAVHEIPGTTFSNPVERGDYASADHACMTLREFEGWLAQWVCCYHERPHSGLGGMSPTMKWTEWFRQREAVDSSTSLPCVPDLIQLRMSLLPFEERTIQHYGVQVFGDTYYHDVLRRYFHAKDLENPRNRRKFIFRFDPRDISRLYFLDPGSGEYFPIPWRNPTKRPCSLWEQRYRLAKKKSITRAGIDEAAIDEHYDRLEQREEESIAKTMAERRKRAKKGLHASRNVHRVLDVSAQKGPENNAPIILNPGTTTRKVVLIAAWSEITPYTEIE